MCLDFLLHIGATRLPKPRRNRHAPSRPERAAGYFEADGGLLALEFAQVYHAGDAFEAASAALSAEGGFQASRFTAGRSGR